MSLYLCGQAVLNYAVLYADPSTYKTKAFEVRKYLLLLVFFPFPKVAVRFVIILTSPYVTTRWIQTSTSKLANMNPVFVTKVVIVLVSVQL